MRQAGTTTGGDRSQRGRWRLLWCGTIMVPLLWSGAADAQQSRSARERILWAQVDERGSINAGVGRGIAWSFGFTCYLGSVSVFANTGRPVAPAAGSTLRVVVDGQAFTFRLTGGTSVGDSSRATDVAVRGLADALLRSRAQSFTVEIPEFGWRQDLPFTEIGRAMGGGPGRNVISNCRPV